eukprot:1775281-Pyramimonas_sp.AAC.1
MLPRGPKRATRLFQVLSELPRPPPEKPQSFKYRRKSMSFAFSPFRFRCAFEPRWPKKAP